LVHAVIWRGDAITDLGTLPGGMRSRALALNERGEIVGFSEAEGAETHAFLYANGRMQDLGSLGKDPVRANAINNHGQIVGASGINAFARHAFLWESGKMKDLNKLLVPGGGWRLEKAMDIDDAGQMLCVGTQPSASGVHHLLLLKPVNGELTSDRPHRLPQR
jgi:probable HAF family extracellular repeat protein